MKRLLSLLLFFYSVSAVSQTPVKGSWSFESLDVSKIAKIPRGTTAQRPAPAVGSLFYNTDSSSLQVSNGVIWVNVGGSGGSTNSNVGTGYRLAIPGTNQIKTIDGVGVLIDTSVSNKVRFFNDTAWLTSNYTLKPIDVFLIAGQSNAQGWVTPATSPTVPAGKVYQYYNGLFSAANDPVGNANTGSAWPAFGIEYNAITGRLVCFVPAAFAGTSQTVAANTGQGTWDTTGTLFDTSVARLNAALIYLIQNRYAPVFKGILWCQGENDANAINTSLINQTTYILAFQKMIGRYRGVYGKNMPFYIFKTGTIQTGSDVGYASVRAAQEQVSNTDSLTVIVFRGAYDFKARGMMQSTYHYTQPAYNEMGRIAADNIVGGRWNGFQPLLGSLYSAPGIKVGVGVYNPTYPFSVADSALVGGLKFSNNGFGNAPSIRTDNFLTLLNTPNLTIFQGLGTGAPELRLTMNSSSTTGPRMGVLNGFNFNAASARQDFLITTSGFSTSGNGRAGNIVLRPGTDYANGGNTTQYTNDSVKVQLPGTGELYVEGGSTFTGNVKLPTQSTSDSSDKAASTKYVKQVLAGYSPGGGGSGNVNSIESSSTDGQLPVFNGTTGLSIKKFTGTGPLKATSGNVSVGNINLASEVTGTLGDASLSANVSLLNANQTFTGIKTFPTSSSSGPSFRFGIGPPPSSPSAGDFGIDNTDSAFYYFLSPSVKIKWPYNVPTVTKGNLTLIQGSGGLARTDTLAMKDTITVQDIYATKILRTGTATDSALVVNPSTSRLEMRKLNSAGVTAHSALTGLSADDHTQYALLAGRTGGQKIIGGTGTTDDLILQTTSGSGASGADMIFQGGNNGATEFARFLNSGFLGIGTTNPQSPLHVYSASGSSQIEIGTGSGGGTASLKLTNAFGGDNWDILNYGNTASNRLRIANTGSEKISILTSGNMGINQTSPGAKLQINTNSLGTTQANSSGLWLQNSTAAANNAQQISPSLVLEGQGWKTNSTAASQSVKFNFDVLPVQGTANPSGNLRIGASINAGAYSTVGTLTSGGNFGLGSATSPSANLHVGGSVRFDLGSDATNDIFYRTSTGPIGRIPIGATGTVLYSNGSSTPPSFQDPNALYNGSTYSPTLTAVANITGTPTATTFHYQRVGDWVYVQGEVTFDPTTAGTLLQLRISIPMTTTFSNSYDASGTGTIETLNETMVVKAEAAANTVRLMCTPVDVSNRVGVSVSFRYKYVAP